MGIDAAFFGLAGEGGGEIADSTADGVTLLRRLSRLRRLTADPNLAGYSVVLSWLKPARPAESKHRFVAETLAVFTDKASAHGLLAQRVTPAQFVKQATVIAFEGTSALGRLP
ncbi:MAG: hypothetical protein ACE5MG_11935, partial [Candidatus Methylomirabilales bacterium]